MESSPGEDSVLVRTGTFTGPDGRVRAGGPPRHSGERRGRGRWLQPPHRHPAAGPDRGDGPAASGGDGPDAGDRPGRHRRGGEPERGRAGARQPRRLRGRRATRYRRRPAWGCQWRFTPESRADSRPLAKDGGAGANRCPRLLRVTAGGGRSGSHRARHTTHRKTSKTACRPHSSFRARRSGGGRSESPRRRCFSRLAPTIYSFTEEVLERLGAIAHARRRCATMSNKTHCGRP